MFSRRAGIAASSSSMAADTQLAVRACIGISCGGLEWPRVRSSFTLTIGLPPSTHFRPLWRDALRVNDWITTQFDAQRIAFLGDSAGGDLALATLYKLGDRGRASCAWGLGAHGVNVS